MRHRSMFIVIALGCACAITFASRAAAGPRTRPVDPIAADALARAAERSATVRSLLATLETSDVIVHVESARGLPHGIGGWTRFIISSGGQRYVRITLNIDLPRRSRAIILAHELQHACEMAQSRAADANAIRELFARSGHRVGAFYETRAALEMERHARMDIGRRYRPSQ